MGGEEILDERPDLDQLLLKLAAYLYHIFNRQGEPSLVAQL